MGQITYSFMKCSCKIYFFRNSANIYRGKDISKYVRESLGLIIRLFLNFRSFALVLWDARYMFVIIMDTSDYMTEVAIDQG